MARQSSICAALFIAAVCTPKPVLCAEPPDWITISDPGNRNCTREEAPGLWGTSVQTPDRGFGRVDYTFQIAKTEVTNIQWLEFVRAYAPYWTGVAFDSNFTGSGVNWSGTTKTYSVTPGTEDFPIAVSWRMAARYCNWLHNNKADEIESFHSGVYDVNSFGVDESTRITDQARRNPNSRYWIPDIDEWTKAMHWDPGFTGSGSGRYRYFPFSSDTADCPLNSSGQVPVGSLPECLSPWGVLDGSGGQQEWLETITWSLTARWVRGSGVGAPLGFIHDRLDWYDSGFPDGILKGLRLAKAVEQPCNAADAADPLSVLDLGDIASFIESYLAGDVTADLALPAGEFDSLDIGMFVDLFVSGCD